MKDKKRKKKEGRKQRKGRKLIKHEVQCKVLI